MWVSTDALSVCYEKLTETASNYHALCNREVNNFKNEIPENIRQTVASTDETDSKYNAFHLFTGFILCCNFI
jgi:hypothetical protein